MSMHLGWPGCLCPCGRGVGGPWVWGVLTQQAGSTFSPLQPVALGLSPERVLVSRAARRVLGWGQPLPPLAYPPPTPGPGWSLHLTLNCGIFWCHFSGGKLSHPPGPSSSTGLSTSHSTAAALVSSTCNLLSTYYVSGMENQARQTRCLPWEAHILVGEADARHGHEGKRVK